MSAGGGSLATELARRLGGAPGVSREALGRPRLARLVRLGNSEPLDRNLTDALRIVEVTIDLLRRKESQVCSAPDSLSRVCRVESGLLLRTQTGPVAAPRSRLGALQIAERLRAGETRFI